MSNSVLRTRLIRLAASRPELRDVLLPILNDGVRTASAVGEEVYVDRNQAARFEMPYYDDIGKVSYVAASTLLRSKGGDGYDQETTAILRPLGGSTLALKHKGYGWHEIVRVVPA